MKNIIKRYLNKKKLYFLCLSLVNTVFCNELPVIVCSLQAPMQEHYNSGISLLKDVIRRYHREVLLIVNPYEMVPFDDINTKNLYHDRFYIVDYVEDPLVQLALMQEAIEKLIILNVPRWSNLRKFLASSEGKSCIKRYNNFVYRYINNNPYPDRVYWLEYKDFLESTFYHISSILLKLYHQKEINVVALQKIIKEEKVKKSYPSRPIGLEKQEKALLQPIVPQKGLN